MLDCSTMQIGIEEQRSLARVYLDPVKPMLGKRLSMLFYLSPQYTPVLGPVGHTPRII